MKKLPNKTFLLGLSLFLLILSLSACAKVKHEVPQPIAVEAEADKKTVAIGDKIRYTVTIDKDRDLQVELPAFGQDLGNFAIKDFGSSRRDILDREKITQWYILDTYITGESIIPKAAIKYKKKEDKEWSEIETGEIKIEVKSSLDKSGQEIRMRDIKGPVNLPSSIMKFLVLAGVSLLAMLGLLAGYFLKKRKRGQVEIKRPAHEIAYEQLEALRARDYIGKAMIKEYYTQVSNIIRRYLENRFGLKAPEMTTEEFLARARQAPELSGEQKNLLKEFLLCCDLVKFAKYAPAVDEVNSVFDSAKQFIDQTKENDPA
ncbi:MAG: hypothetical protein PHO81_03850 [Candidatus Omnitrophica bacterium]|nr:hypothetical protein [Candidatus Omnitrophota bacterium]